MLLSAVSLIDRFIKGISFDALYERAIRHYDILLEIIEGDENLDDVLSHSGYSLEEIRAAALDIVDALIYNDRGDPFLSLGLPSNISYEVLKKRWKRLISLYHPDLYPDQKYYEEKAKKINAAYNEAVQSLEKRGVAIEKDSERVFSKYKEYDFKSYRGSVSPGVLSLLKRLPLLILISVVFVALITVGFFIKSRMNEDEIILTAGVEVPPEDDKDIDNRDSLSFLQILLSSKEEDEVIKKTRERGEKTDVPVLLEQDSVKIQTESEFDITRKYILKDLDLQEREIEKRQVSEKEELPDTSSQGDTESVEVEKTSPSYVLVKKQNSRTAKEGLIKDEILKEEKKGRSEKEISINDKKQDEQKDIKKEIHLFLQQYKKYYERGDLLKFLSLFAEDAVENGEKVARLKEVYKRIFTESENRYELKDIVIDLKNLNTAEVRAKFDIQRLIKRDGRVYRYRGDVKWVIKIKGDELKIVSLYYE